MNFFQSLKIALQQLKINKLRSALTMLGIIIGVTSVVLLISLGTGLANYITSQFEQLGSNLLFVIPGRIGPGGRGPGGTVINKLTLAHVRLIEKNVAEIAGLAPTIQKFATVKYKNRSDKDVTLVGTTQNFPQVLNLPVAEGQFFNKNQSDLGENVVVLGKTVVNNFFAQENPINKKIEISGKKYLVAGVLAERGSTFGFDQDNTVVVSIIAARRQFGTADQINNIYIKAQTQVDVGQVREKVIAALTKDLTEEDFSVLTAQQTLETVRQILGVISAALAGIAAISLIVGGIGISNIMLVSVTERTREIGLRKAVGAKPADILLQFLTESVTLSILGGVVGLIIAGVGTLAVSRFIPATITFWSVIVAFGFSALVGVIFGTAPAIRAARLNPIDALHYE